MNDLTRTIETEQNYLKRAESLLRKTALFFDCDISNVTAYMLAQYLIEQRHTYTPSTFRQYKSACIFYLNTYSYRHNDYLSAIELLNDTSQSDCQKITDKTSQLRRKNFSENLFNEILFAISLTESKYANATILWLKCGAITGLRPHEWEFTEIVERDNKCFLKVKNSKNTNGRSHGEYRHIDITDIEEQDLKNIKDFLVIVNLYKDQDFGFDFLQRSCQDLLKSINSRLTKGDYQLKYFKSSKGGGVYKKNGRNRKIKRITLYSARHFFSSSAKSNLTREEVAALMGHKTNRTATEHYGKVDYERRSKFKVKPVSEEVNKVEQKYNYTVGKNNLNNPEKSVKISTNNPNNSSIKR